MDEGKTRVARTLSSVASSLKTGSSEMQTGDAAAIGGVVERVADQIDRAANYLERSEVDEIVSGVERFARRNPALFIGAACYVMFGSITSNPCNALRGAALLLAGIPGFLFWRQRIRVS